MTHRSDSLALALSGTVHAAAIWAVLAVIAHDRLPDLPFVIDLNETVSEAPQTVVTPPAPVPPAPTSPAIRPAPPARHIEPPRRAEPPVTPPPPVAVAPAPPVVRPAAPARMAEATRVAPEPVASPVVGAPPVAAAPRDGQAPIPAGAGSPPGTPAIAASNDVAVNAPPSVAALPPAPAAALPITRPARPRGGYQVKPAYPAEARRANAEGTTLLRVHVGTDGSIDDVMVESSAGHEALDRAAADAIRAWRFEPARNAAGAVAVWVVVPVNFHLRAE